MTDHELIGRWPHAPCYDCGARMRPSITREGKLLTSLDGMIVWMVCERCFVARCMPLRHMVALSIEGSNNHDMTRWIEITMSLHPGVVAQPADVEEDEEEMAEPLTTQEIMAMSTDQRDMVVRLRVLFKDLVASGLDPARIRATITGATK